MARASYFFPIVITVFGVVGGLRAAEIPWPKDYEIRSESESPNGRYGVAIPPVTMADEDDLKVIDYLADLKEHRLLGQISAAHYFQSKNHSGLNAIWSPDSSCCAVVYEKHFGFDTITILEIEGANFRETDVGRHVDRAFAEVIEKASHHEKDLDIDAVVFCRMSRDGKFRIRALATTNPREFHDRSTYLARFQGTFDLKTRKWTGSDARSIRTEERDALRVAYKTLEPDLSSTTFGSTDEKLEWLDEQLNGVYQGLRFLLKPERFAQVKSQQIAWLKKRNAASSVSEKCTLLVERIDALRELIW